MAEFRITGSFRPLLTLIAGIFIYHSFDQSWAYIEEVAAFSVLLFLSTWWWVKKSPSAKNRAVTGIIGLACILILSVLASFLKNKPKTLPVSQASVTHYKVTLVKAVALKPASVSSVGQLEAVLANGKWYPAEGQVALFLPHSPQADTLQYGHQLLVKGSLKPPAEPANPYQFDYKHYLNLRHIQWQAYLPAGSWMTIGYAPANYITVWSLQARKKLEQAFKKHIETARELIIANALILGVQDDLDASLRNAYARTGTMHVLAVSGLHVGLLYAALLFFLRHLRRGRNGRILVFLLIVGIVWFYAFMTGLSASVLRSVCMFSLVEFGRLLQRKSSILNTLAVVALALLLYEPNFLFDVGFQLSFLAVAGIVLLQPLFLRLWHPKNKIVLGIWNLLAISVAAQLATFPVSLYYFHQFPVYFWIANLIAVPATTIALYLGIAFMALFWVPMLNKFLGVMLQGVLWCLNELLLWLEHWPYAVLDGFVITPVQVLALYLLLFSIVLFLFRKNLAWLSTSVLCVALISGIELAEASRQRKNREFTLHSVRRSSAVSILNGRKVTFLADSSFYAQPHLFGYQVQPYWWAKGMREEVRFTSDLEKTGLKQEVPVHTWANGNRLVVWQGKSFFWLNQMPTRLPSPVPIDVVILQHNVWVKPDKIKEAFACKTLLIDQTNSRSYTAKKAAEFKAAGYRVHVLEDEGAWRIRVPK